MIWSRCLLILGHQLHIRLLRTEQPRERRKQALVLVRISMVGRLLCMTRQVLEWRVHSLKVSWSPLLVILDVETCATSHSQPEDQTVVLLADALAAIAPCQLLRCDDALISSP